MPADFQAYEKELGRTGLIPLLARHGFDRFFLDRRHRTEQSIAKHICVTGNHTKRRLELGGHRLQKIIFDVMGMTQFCGLLLAAIV